MTITMTKTIAIRLKKKLDPRSSALIRGGNF